MNLTPYGRHAAIAFATAARLRHTHPTLPGYGLLEVADLMDTLRRDVARMRHRHMSRPFRFPPDVIEQMKEGLPDFSSAAHFENEARNMNIRASRQTPPAFRPDPAMRVVRHVKRGTFYAVMGHGEVQLPDGEPPLPDMGIASLFAVNGKRAFVTNGALPELGPGEAMFSWMADAGAVRVQADGGMASGTAVTLYIGEDAQLWARATAEFEDGRFETVAVPPEPEA